MNYYGKNTDEAKKRFIQLEKNFNDMYTIAKLFNSIAQNVDSLQGDDTTAQHTEMIFVECIIKQELPIQGKSNGNVQ